MAEILFISKYIRTLEEGTPTRHYFFCKNLIKRGHQVKIIKSRASFAANLPPFKGYYKLDREETLELVTINGPLIPRGFTIKRLVTWFSFEFGVIRYLRSLKNYRPDIVIVSSLSIFTFLTGIWLKRKFGIPLIVEVRDIYPLTLTDVAGYKKYNPLILIMGFIEKLGYRNADYIVSSLDHLDVHVRNIIGRNFKFKWIPTGFEKEIYENLPEPENQESLIKIKVLKESGNFLIGYAGTIGLANALDMVFDAARKMQLINPKIQFVFIGNGPLKSNYKEKNRDLNNIHFIDFVKKQYLPDLLSYFDILINTWKKSDIYSYGISPNKWNEYMYSGRPFILSHDYNSKIFDEATCGWQIPANDIEQLIEKINTITMMDRHELDILGDNGRKYLLNKLSYTYLSSLYEEVINACIKANNKC